MFAIWTNTSCSFYKYIGQLGQIHFAKNNWIIFYFEYDTKLLLYSSYIKNKILLLWRRNRLYFRQSFSILCEGSKLRNTFLWPSKQAAPREAKMPTPYYLQFLASWRPLSQPSHVILPPQLIALPMTKHPYYLETSGWGLVLLNSLTAVVSQVDRASIFNASSCPAVSPVPRFKRIREKFVYAKWTGLDSDTSHSNATKSGRRNTIRVKMGILSLWTLDPSFTSRDGSIKQSAVKKKL